MSYLQDLQANLKALPESEISDAMGSDFYCAQKLSSFRRKNNIVGSVCLSHF